MGTKWLKNKPSFQCLRSSLDTSQPKATKSVILRGSSSRLHGLSCGKERRGGDKRTGMLNVLGAGGSGSAPGSRKGSIADGGIIQAAPPPPKDSGKVRFAGFVAVEVRGRQVLVKAPVWTLG